MDHDNGAVMQEKPKLIAPNVPWFVSTSVPALEVEGETGKAPRAVVFTAYFKRTAPEAERWSSDSVAVAEEPGPFRPAQPDERGEYQRVRIQFANPIAGRLAPATSDREVVAKDAFDWSGVPGRNGPAGESVKAFLERSDRYFLETGFSDDPRFYTVEKSPWLKEVAPDRSDLHHYILLGAEEYLEVIAAGWEWELGQVA